MKVNIIKEKAKSINLVPMGDWHVGSKECNMKKIVSMIDWIKTTKNARTILMGDLMDFGLKDSVGAGVYDNNMHPEKQYEKILELLMPIRHKIYGMHTGNHEERIRQRTDFDMTRLLCRELGVKYLGPSALNRITVGKAHYIIFTTHGSSGSTLPHTKMKAVRGFASYIDADCYCMGHVHDIDTSSDIKIKLNIGNKQVEEHKRYFVLTGHYLKYGGYAEQKGYLPGKSGSPNIRLDGQKKDLHVSI